MLPSLQAAIGADNVYQPPLQMGAEDFAYYAKQVPSMFFFVGATAKGIDPAQAQSNHSPEFMLDESALDVGRSEEHTSELQSLMRITYAVFCLKKKKNTKQ